VSANRLQIALVGTISVLFLMAPTVGDVGGCGVTAQPLTQGQFANARKQEDCKRCTQCKLGSDRCLASCDAGVPSDYAFPDTCKPLYEDGLVCIRALAASSCDDYARYMDDTSPEAPTECQFCRVVPAPVPTVFEDGGAL
jgi:hypothetical protein